MPKKARTSRKYNVQMYRNSRFLIFLCIWLQRYKKKIIKDLNMDKITYIINKVLQRRKKMYNFEARKIICNILGKNGNKKSCNNS